MYYQAFKRWIHSVNTGLDNSTSQRRGTEYSIEKKMRPVALGDFCISIHCKGSHHCHNHHQPFVSSSPLVVTMLLLLSFMLSWYHMIFLFNVPFVSC